MFSLFLHVIIQESGSRLSAVETILMLGHEASDSSHRGVFSQAGNLSVRFNSVVFESLEGNRLVGSLHLLRACVNLLFALLTASSKTQDKVKSRLLLDVVIAQSTTIFQLLSSEDKTLLIRRDSFLILDLGFDIVDGVAGFDIQSDGLACYASDERISESKRVREGLSEVLLRRCQELCLETA